METFHRIPEPGGEVCDFCTGGPIDKLYSCRNFIWNKRAIFVHESIGAWAACRDCAELIDRDAWSSLTERALQCFAREHAVARYDLPAVREQLREIHQLFRQHMIREY